MWLAIRFLAGTESSAASFVIMVQSVKVAGATEVDLLLALAEVVSGSVGDQKFALAA
jgi:hypothetical protein